MTSDRCRFRNLDSCVSMVQPAKEVSSSHRVSLRLKASDLPVSAHITDAACLEAMTLCRGAALAIEASAPLLQPMGRRIRSVAQKFRVSNFIQTQLGHRS